MCGVAGWLGHLTDSETRAGLLAQALRHRGPDAHGIQIWPEAALVHTRLSIIDLSPSGSQPMANEDESIWTVFNGEIYNHRELRRDLESKGHRFRGHSDTEVLPHLYEEEGPEFLTKLRGMFALAIYDKRHRRLLLARDRFGIKPLFYAAGNNRLAFASEIRSLLELPDIDARPDPQAIYDFSALFYIPAPATFYKGIRALEPAQILEAQVNSTGIAWKTKTYHRWTIAPNAELSLADAADQADALLTTAVRRQMESEVPLGTLLSGGIDSSLVSAAAQGGLKSKLQTFNVRFPDPGYDETWAALEVAKHIGSQHETLDMDSGQGTWEQITELLRHAGQPYADTSIFAAHAVCRLMRQHVTVALSGDGGDEGFGGYDTYWQIERIARLQRIPRSIWRAAALGAAPLAQLGVVRDSLPQRIQALAGADNTSIVQNLFSWIRAEEQEQVCPMPDVLPVRRLFESEWDYHLPKNASRLERLSAQMTEVNTRLVLPNDFLFKVDTASMKESLEVRVPMLDEDLFAFGLSLPHHLKVKGQTCKRVLREVAKRRLPQSVANKPKRGFGVPLDTWLDVSFKKRLKDALLGPSSRLSDFFRPSLYKPIVEAFCDGRPVPGISREGLYQRAIMFLSVQMVLDVLDNDKGV